MRFFVRRSLAIVAVAAAAAACGSTTAPQSVDETLSADWRSALPCTNNPGGCFGLTFTLSAQGNAIAGSGTTSWIGTDSVAVSGTVDGRRVHLTIVTTTGEFAGQTSEFDGTLTIVNTLSGAYRPDVNSAETFTLRLIANAK